MKKYQTIPWLLILTFALLACSGGSPKVDSFLDSYENVIEGFEDMAEKGSISIQDMNKMNTKNIAMASEGTKLQSEEWTDAQRKQYLELTNRFSKAMFKISENM